MTDTRPDPTQVTREAVRARIEAARASRDPIAIIEAIEAFFEFFDAHHHTWTEASSDPYNPFRTERETDGPRVY